MQKFILFPSSRKDKRYMILGENNKVIHFGSSKHENFTIHKNEKRKQLYIQRHSSRENWGKSGIDTAGWWAVHMLWNKPTLKESIENIENKYNIKIYNQA